jgi:hypothetical protein
MRNRVRIQPYIAPDIRRTLATYSAAQGVTESAVAEAALREYFERDGIEEALVIRRLDGVAHAVAKLQDDLDVLAQAFSRFAKYSFMVASSAPSLDASSRGDALFGQFLSSVCSDLGSGVRFSGAVRRALGSKTARPPGSTGDKGR